MFWRLLREDENNMSCFLLYVICFVNFRDSEMLQSSLVYLNTYKSVNDPRPWNPPGAMLRMLLFLRYLTKQSVNSGTVKLRKLRGRIFESSATSTARKFQPMPTKVLLIIKKIVRCSHNWFITDETMTRFYLASGSSTSDQESNLCDCFTWFINLKNILLNALKAQFRQLYL